MRLQIKTGSIDMYGALGRDHHPRKDDKGIFVMVDTVETEIWDCPNGCDENGGTNSDCEFCGGTTKYPTKIFTGTTAAGRVLQIMDYEVAEIKVVE